jgi:hypothetical protein
MRAGSWAPAGRSSVLESRNQSCVDDWMKQNRPVVWESPPQAVISARA